MKMPGFTAEASLDGTSDRYRRMSLSPVPTNGTGEARVAGTPRVAGDHDGLAFAWTETRNGASRVQTARAALR